MDNLQLRENFCSLFVGLTGELHKIKLSFGVSYFYTDGEYKMFSVPVVNICDPAVMLKGLAAVTIYCQIHGDLGIVDLIQSRWKIYILRFQIRI